jgi:hypothetical protein
MVMKLSPRRRAQIERGERIKNQLKVGMPVPNAQRWWGLVRRWERHGATSSAKSGINFPLVEKVGLRHGLERGHVLRPSI